MLKNTFSGRFQELNKTYKSISYVTSNCSGTLISTLRLFTFVFFIMFSIDIYGYKTDYKLDGNFIVESKNQSLQKNLELWHVSLLRGTVDDRKAFVDFEVIVWPIILRSKTLRYSLGDPQVYTYDQLSQENSLSFIGDSFIFETGIVSKGRVNKRV